MSETTLLRLDQVRMRTGLCRSAIYTTPGFPKAVKLGGKRAVAWVSHEIEAWIRLTIAVSRDAGADQQAVGG